MTEAAEWTERQQMNPIDRISPSPLRRLEPTNANKHTPTHTAAVAGSTTSSARDQDDQSGTITGYAVCRTPQPHDTPLHSLVQLLRSGLIDDNDGTVIHRHTAHATSVLDYFTPQPPSPEHIAIRNESCLRT